MGLISNTTVDNTQAVTPAIFAHLSSLAGANAARFTLDWRDLESQKGVWDTSTWNAVRDLYDTLEAQGITPVFSLCCAPPWARTGLEQYCIGTSCTYPPSRNMNAAWADFAAHAASRFPKAVFEIWNEPNIPQFWASGPNPTRYAELVKIAYQAIKKVSPRAIVLAGALDNNQTTDGGEGSNGQGAIPMRQFLARAYGAQPSIRNYMDALSIHTTAQDMRYGKGTFFAKVLHDARRTAKNYGDKGRHIWITEAGLSTTGPKALTPRDQADGVMRQYRRFMTMPDIDGVLFNSLVENPAVPYTNTNRGFGWVFLQQPDFPPKLAFCAFADRANPLPPSGCPNLFQPHLPPGLVRLHKHAKAACRKWYKPTRRWRSSDHSGRAAIVAACASRYIILHPNGHIKRLKTNSRARCEKRTPPASHWRNHGVGRRLAALRSCRFGLIRSGLHVVLPQFKSRPSGPAFGSK